MPEGTNEAATGEKGGESNVLTPEPKQASKTEAAKPPPAEAKVEKKEAPPPAAKEEKADKTDKKPEARTLGEDDDEIPEDAELVQMSKAALSKRLARHTKKELRDRFGTDDVEKIKADQAELAQLRKEREEKRRAEMSEIDRAKEDAAKEKKKREEAEAELQRERDAATFSDYSRSAEEVLSKEIAPKHMKRAMRELKEHILGLEEEPDPKGFKKFLDGWTKEFVKENPEFAKPAAEEPKKIGLTTGSNPNAKREKGNAELAHKTPTPGKVNSMSRSEYAAFKRERGFG